MAYIVFKMIAPRHLEPIFVVTIPNVTAVTN